MSAGTKASRKALVRAVNVLAQRVHQLAVTNLVFETVLEHHGLLSQDIIKACSPAIEAKFKAMSSSGDKPESSQEATPAAPERTETPDGTEV